MMRIHSVMNWIRLKRRRRRPMTSIAVCDDNIGHFLVGWGRKIFGEKKKKTKYSLRASNISTTQEGAVKAKIATRINAHPYRSCQLFTEF